MLNENDVVVIVERFLREAGWTILRRSNTTQTGPDLEAKHYTSARLLYVEAKGATSARPGSARYSRPFDRSQVRDHVANAFYVAAKVPDEHMSAIAVPRTPLHEEFLEGIRCSLLTLKIAVLWVGEDKIVTTWNWQDDRRASTAGSTHTDRLEEPVLASDSAEPSTDDSGPARWSKSSGAGRDMTERELQDKLRAFRQYLEDQGYKSEPLGFRMDGACRFALFLAGRPLRKGEGPPDGWRGR